MTYESQTDVRALGASIALFERFEQSNIRYCHFKSNEHLAEGLYGDTDLDVLVDRRQHQEATLALLQSGFKRFHAIFKYPAVEDYMGFDPETGRLLHVHLHFTLIVGEKDIKSYHLHEFGDAILSTCQRDPVHDIKVCEPHHEMLLLLIRSALKIRARDYLKAFLGKARLGKDVAREFEWLKERTEPERTEAIARETLGDEAADLIPGLVGDLPTIWQLRPFRSRLKKALSWSRAYTSLESYGVIGLRALVRNFSGVKRRYLQIPMATRRVHVAGGCVIALLGMDGAGKSTANAELKRWLSWKLDTYPVYFGSGDGSASLLRLPLKWAGYAIYALRGAARNERSKKEKSFQDDLHRDIRITLPVLIWAVFLALEKRSKFKRVHRACSRGMIVICDRYPQTQIKGHNDGALLGAWTSSSSPLKRKLAAWEYSIYAQSMRNRLDLVIKLDLPAEVALGRRPSMTIEDLARRREVVQKIEFGEACEHVTIDASADLDKVWLDMKRAIWSHM